MCILQNPENTRFQPQLIQGCLSDWVSHQKSCLLPWTNLGFLHSTWLGLSNRALTPTFPTGIPFTELCRGGDTAAVAAADRNKGRMSSVTGSCRGPSLHPRCLQARGEDFPISSHSATKAGACYPSEGLDCLLSLLHFRAWSCLEKGPRRMLSSATLLLSKTLTKADGREQKRSEHRNGAGPRGERRRR